MPEILNQEIIAGTTLEWIESIDDYPSSEFDCKIVIRRSNDSPVDITSEESETVDAFDFSASASETENLPNGDYLFQYIFTEKAETKKVYAPKTYSGVVAVGSLLSSANDSRSHDQIVYDALCDAELKIAGRDYVNVNINGKSTEFKTLEEIRKAKIYYGRKLGMHQQPQLVYQFNEPT